MSANYNRARKRRNNRKITTALERERRQSANKGAAIAKILSNPFRNWLYLKK